MRCCEFQASGMKLALQIVLTDLDVAQGHGQALVTEQQLHSGKTDTSAQHPSCKGMSKLMGQDRRRTAGALRSPVQCLPDSMVGRTGGGFRDIWRLRNEMTEVLQRERIWEGVSQGLKRRYHPVSPLRGSVLLPLDRGLTPAANTNAAAARLEWREPGCYRGPSTPVRKNREASAQDDTGFERSLRSGSHRFRAKPPLGMTHSSLARARSEGQQ